jgi:hypothetical protein
MKPSSCSRFSKDLSSKTWLYLDGLSEPTDNEDSLDSRVAAELPPSVVEKYIGTIASRSEAKEKMRPNFDKPTREVVN